MRVSVFYQKCRYAKKTQISLNPKKYRYVGVIAGLAKDGETTIFGIASILKKS
jgi:hypothetical protein